MRDRTIEIKPLDQVSDIHDLTPFLGQFMNIAPNLILSIQENVRISVKAGKTIKEIVDYLRIEFDDFNREKLSERETNYRTVIRTEP